MIPHMSEMHVWVQNIRNQESKDRYQQSKSARDGSFLSGPCLGILLHSRCQQLPKLYRIEILKIIKTQYHNTKRISTEISMGLNDINAQNDMHQY